MSSLKRLLIGRMVRLRDSGNHIMTPSYSSSIAVSVNTGVAVYVKSYGMA